jgi:NAD(P)-dependent dehydrogenase (short-subunit alcohol dehydrogenase family)
MSVDFKDKTVVITGASRGIGKALAIQLGQQGAQIIALARTIGGLEEIDDAIKQAGGKSPLLVPLDLNDLQSLSTLGTQLAGRYERVDAVFGCAALLTKLGPLMHSPLLHLQQSLHLNVLANATLLQTLHPLLIAAPAPQAVFLLNQIDHTPKAFWAHYAASQSALRTMLTIYDQENPEIKTHLLEPPPTDTWLFREAYPGHEGTLNTPEQTATWVLGQL